MLSEAHEKMTTGRFRRLPVMDTGALVGILTDRDILRHWGSETRTKVQAAKTETPLTIPPDMTIEKVIQPMLRDQISGLPVVHNSKLIGIVTASDIFTAFLEVTGASTPGSIRINLLLQDNEHLVDGTQIIHAVNCEILAMGTYEQPVSNRRAYILCCRR